MTTMSERMHIADGMISKYEALFEQLLAWGSGRTLDPSSLVISELVASLNNFQHIQDINKLERIIRSKRQADIIAIVPFIPLLYFNMNPTPLNEAIFPSSSNKPTKLISNASHSLTMIRNKNVIGITSEFQLQSNNNDSVKLSPILIQEHFSSIQQVLIVAVRRKLESVTDKEQMDFAFTVIELIFHKLRTLLDWRDNAKKRVTISKPLSEKCLHFNVDSLININNSFINTLHDLISNTVDGEFLNFLNHHHSIHSTDNFNYGNLQKSNQSANVDCDLCFGISSSEFAFTGVEIKTNLNKVEYNKYYESDFIENNLSNFGNDFTSFQIASYSSKPFSDSSAIFNLDFKTFHKNSTLLKITEIFRQVFTYMACFRFKNFLLTDGSNFSFIAPNKEVIEKMLDNKLNAENVKSHRPVSNMRSLKDIKSQIFKLSEIFFDEFIISTGISNFEAFKQDILFKVFDAAKEENPEDFLHIQEVYRKYREFVVPKLLVFHLNNPLIDEEQILKLVTGTNLIPQLKEIMFVEILKNELTNSKINSVSLNEIQDDFIKEYSNFKHFFEDSLLALPMHELVFRTNSSCTVDGTIIPVQTGIFYMNFLNFKINSTDFDKLEDESFSKILELLLLNPIPRLEANENNGADAKRDTNDDESSDSSDHKYEDNGPNEHLGEKDEENDSSNNSYKSDMGKDGGNNEQKTPGDNDCLNYNKIDQDDAILQLSSGSTDSTDSQFLRSFTSNAPLLGASKRYKYGILSIKNMGKELHPEPSFILVYEVAKEDLLNVFPELSKFESQLPGKLILKMYDAYIIEQWYVKYAPEILHDEPWVVQEKYNCFKQEIESFNKINDYNKHIENEEDIINVPKIYFSGPYRFNDHFDGIYQGKMIIMEKLELDGYQFDKNVYKLHEPVYRNLINECISLVKKLNEIGIVHNDIRSSNFIFSKKKLYVIDFSMAMTFKTGRKNNPVVYYDFGGNEEEEEIFNYFGAKLDVRFDHLW